jgi:hypothetical protein
MKWVLRRRAFLTGLVLLAACASPRVKYEKITESDTTGAPKFQLSDSVIQFAYPTEGEGAARKQNTNKFIITSVPIAAGDALYSINGTSWYQNWGVETTIMVKHRNDTLLLQEVGSTVSDKRAEAIKTLASAAGTGIAMFGAKAIPAPIAGTMLRRAPDGISISNLLANSPTRCTVPPAASDRAGRDQAITCKDVELDGGYATDEGGNKAPTRYTADIDIGPVPVSAFKKMPPTSNSLVYSACRSFYINVKNANQPDLTAEASLIVADPTWLDAIKFPPKGKIITGATCGADAAPEDAALPGQADYINSLMTMGQTIKDALDKKPNDNAGAK